MPTHLMRESALRASHNEMGMKHNGPVTDAEYVLPDGEVIITHTDTTSRIAYANPAFLRSSEFTLDECLGQPQNIVRHPDMPREAFADLWATVQAGKPWTGIVKNRRKGGGFYWVRANVTPMMNGRRVVGYMSVRVKPTHEEISGAARAYADIRAGRARDIRIEAGHIKRTGLAGVLDRLAHLSLATGTWMFVGATAAIMGTMTLVNFVTSGLDFVTLLGALGSILAFANMLYVQNRVVKPLVGLQKATLQLMGGDTSSRIPIRGVSCIIAVAESLEQLRTKLDGVLKDNLHAATEVGGSVAEVLTSNTALSNRTNEHAASLEETAASIEELTAGVTRNTDSASHAAQLARQSEVTTEQGRDVMKQLYSTMEAISQSSKRIAEIVGIIDGIAFQTNLLALNAAVEAARAGDQGRGFAVVAQEVRSLAQRSAASAKEIRDLIQASSETVDRGSALASEAEVSMQQVVDSGKRVANVIAEIESASREQAAGIEQINKAITQMDQLTQDDAQMAQRLLMTAEILQGQSQQMLAAISAFSMQSEVASAVPAPITTAPAVRQTKHRLARAA